MSTCNICTKPNTHRFPQFYLFNSRFIALLIHVVSIHPYIYLMFPSEKHLFLPLYAILMIFFFRWYTKLLYSQFHFQQFFHICHILFQSLSHLLSSPNIFHSLWFPDVFHRNYWISFLNPLQCTVRASHMALFHYLGLNFVHSFKSNIKHMFSSLADTKI